MHSGHFFVGVGCAVSTGRNRLSSRFIGLTTRKNSTAATIRNEMSAFNQAP